MLLHQPVFKPQSRNLGEVHGVLGEEKRVVGNGDAGDLEVHGADADALLAKGEEESRRILIQRQNRPRCVSFNETVKFPIGIDLPERIGCGMDFFQPAFDAFLHIYHSGGYLVTSCVQALGQPFGEGPSRLNADRWLVSSTTTGLNLLFVGLAAAILFACLGGSFVQFGVVRPPNSCPPVFLYGR